MLSALVLCLSLAQAPTSGGDLPRTLPVKPQPLPKGVEKPIQRQAEEIQILAAVERMQKFYEQTKDFTATFRQRYTYKSFGTTTEATGRVRFLKEGQMRWDYLEKDGSESKVFVVADRKVTAWDKAARQMTIAGFEMDKLSASVTFLMGKGKLEREFNIKRASRKDLGDGLTLELTPKKADPRFNRIFLVVDPETSAVRTSLVVDPDGSENRIDFSDLKSNTGLTPDLFKLEPPPGTQVLNLDRP